MFGKKSSTPKSGGNLFTMSGGLSEQEQFELAIKLSLEEELTNKKKETPTKDKTSNKETLQWVKEVTSFSTEYAGWPAKNVIGPSNTYPNYGDLKTCWAPSSSTGTVEFLELTFETKVIPKSIKVYETYNPGALIKVSGKDGNQWIVLWEGPKQTNPGKSVINDIKFKQVDFVTNEIRLDMDCTTQTAYYEIDAVQLSGEEVKTPLTLQVPVTFANWYENPDFADFTFLLDKESVPAHKFVLANASEKLLKIVTSTSEMKIDFPQDEFYLVLKYIYTGRYSLTSKFCPTVLKIADYFDLADLRKGCFEFMVSSLNKDTVIETMLKAKNKEFDFDATDLVQKCVEFIQERAFEVFGDKSLYLFDKDIMISLVKGDNLAIDEYELFDHLIKWGKNKVEKNKEHLNEYLKDVVCHVRFPLMDAEVLYYKVKPSKFITDEQYLEALEYNLDSSLFATNETRFKSRGSVFKGSTIVNAKYGAFLLKWVPKTNKSWNCIYRGTKNGFDASQFHATCDNKGETITVIKSTSGQIFGGYNPVSWSQSGSYSNDMKCFIFTLSNSENVPPSKFTLMSGKNGAYNCSGYGPTFGGGHDIYICSNSNTVTSNYSNFGYSFTTPPGFNDTTKKQRLLAGSYNFQVSEIEVFALK